MLKVFQTLLSIMLCKASNIRPLMSLNVKLIFGLDELSYRYQKAVTVCFIASGKKRGITGQLMSLASCQRRYSAGATNL